MKNLFKSTENKKTVLQKLTERIIRMNKKRNSVNSENENEDYDSLLDKDSPKHIPKITPSHRAGLIKGSNNNTSELKTHAVRFQELENKRITKRNSTFVNTVPFDTNYFNLDVSNTAEILNPYVKEP